VKDEASVQLLPLAEKAVVRAVLNGGAIGGEVDAGAGEPFTEVAANGGLCLKLKGRSQQATDPHSFIWRGTFKIRIFHLCSVFNIFYGSQAQYILWVFQLPFDCFFLHLHIIFLHLHTLGKFTI